MAALTKTCQYKNCNEAHYPDRRNLRYFFPFPVRDPKRCEKWIANAEKPDFNFYPSDIIRMKFICDKHFAKGSFVDFKRSKLKDSAVPTLDDAKPTIAPASLLEYLNGMNGSQPRKKRKPNVQNMEIVLLDDQKTIDENNIMLVMSSDEKNPRSLNGSHVSHSESFQTVSLLPTGDGQFSIFQEESSQLSPSHQMNSSDNDGSSQMKEKIHGLFQGDFHQPEENVAKSPRANYPLKFEIVSNESVAVENMQTIEDFVDGLPKEHGLYAVPMSGGGSTFEDKETQNDEPQKQTAEKFVQTINEEPINPPIATQIQPPPDTLTETTLKLLADQVRLNSDEIKKMKELLATRKNTRTRRKKDMLHAYNQIRKFVKPSLARVIKLNLFPKVKHTQFEKEMCVKLYRSTPDTYVMLREQWGWSLPRPSLVKIWFKNANKVVGNGSVEKKSVGNEPSKVVEVSAGQQLPKSEQGECLKTVEAAGNGPAKEVETMNDQKLDENDQSMDCLTVEAPRNEPEKAIETFNGPNLDKNESMDCVTVEALKNEPEKVIETFNGPNLDKNEQSMECVTVEASKNEPPTSGGDQPAENEISMECATVEVINEPVQTMDGEKLPENECLKSFETVNEIIVTEEVADEGESGKLVESEVVETSAVSGNERGQVEEPAGSEKESDKLAGELKKIFKC